MLRIKNQRIYGLPESIQRSGYPMRTGEPDDLHILDDILTQYESKEVKRAEKLAQVDAGTGHDNFLKGIIIQFDLCYPQYISPQLQRYNWIDIVSSQSKMHRLVHNRDIRENCNAYVLESFIDKMNFLLRKYNENIYPFSFKDGPDYMYKIQDKYTLFMFIISNLPMGYELWMGISTNYLQLKTIYQQRKNHKLKEDWGEFCKFIENLPFSHLITGKNETK